MYGIHGGLSIFQAKAYRTRLEVMIMKGYVIKGILILGSPRLMYWSPFSVLGLVFQKPNCPSQLQVDMSNGSLLVAVCMLTCSILQTCLHVLLYSKAVYSRCLPVIVYIRKTTDTGPQYPENDF